MNISKYGSRIDDEVMTWEFLDLRVRKCPHCGASKHYMEIRNFMGLWQDGHIFCNYCESYLGHWDRYTGDLK